MNSPLQKLIEATKSIFTSEVQQNQMPNTQPEPEAPQVLRNRLLVTCDAESIQSLLGEREMDLVWRNHRRTAPANLRNLMHSKLRAAEVKRLAEILEPELERQSVYGYTVKIALANFLGLDWESMEKRRSDRIGKWLELQAQPGDVIVLIPDLEKYLPSELTIAAMRPAEMIHNMRDCEADFIFVGTFDQMPNPIAALTGAEWQAVNLPVDPMLTDEQGEIAVTVDDARSEQVDACKSGIQEFLEVNNFEGRTELRLKELLPFAIGTSEVNSEYCDYIWALIEFKVGKITGSSSLEDWLVKVGVLAASNRPEQFITETPLPQMLPTVLLVGPSTGNKSGEIRDLLDERIDRLLNERFDEPFLKPTFIHTPILQEMSPEALQRLREFCWEDKPTEEKTSDS